MIQLKNELTTATAEDGRWRMDLTAFCARTKIFAEVA
jgi:hypothetical protein